ncbi:MAG: hypothetical protein ABIH11_02685 [Candidatus Altiarchaeota archaeon]
MGRTKLILWVVLSTVIFQGILLAVATPPSGVVPDKKTTAEIVKVFSSDVDEAVEGLAGVKIGSLTYNPTVFCPPGASDCKVTAGVSEMIDTFISLTIPFYVIAVLFTGLFFIFKSGSPKARARARSMFLKLLYGMFFVVMSPAIYQVMLDMDVLLVRYLVHDIPVTMDLWFFELSLPGNPLPPVGKYLNVLSHPISYAPGGIAYCMFMIVYLMAVIFASIIAWVRNILVFVYGVFFPIIVFFYSFDPTKAWGKKWFNDAIKWVFVPVIQAAILAFTIAIVFSVSQSMSFNTPVMNSMVFFAICAGNALFAAAPLIVGQVMGWFGNAIVAMGLGSGRTWMVAWGGILAGQGHSGIAYAHSEYSRQRAYENMMAANYGMIDMGYQVQGMRGAGAIAAGRDGGGMIGGGGGGVQALGADGTAASVVAPAVGHARPGMRRTALGRMRAAAQRAHGDYSSFVDHSDDFSAEDSTEGGGVPSSAGGEDSVGGHAGTTGHGSPGRAGGRRGRAGGVTSARRQPAGRPTAPGPAGEPAVEADTGASNPMDKSLDELAMDQATGGGDKPASPYAVDSNADDGQGVSGGMDMDMPSAVAAAARAGKGGKGIFSEIANELDSKQSAEQKVTASPGKPEPLPVDQQGGDVDQGKVGGDDEYHDRWEASDNKDVAGMKPALAAGMGGGKAGSTPDGRRMENQSAEAAKKQADDMRTAEEQRALRQSGEREHEEAGQRGVAVHQRLGREGVKDHEAKGKEGSAESEESANAERRKQDMKKNSRK